METNKSPEQRAREYRYNEHHPTGHYTDIQIEDIKEYAYLQGWEDNTSNTELREALREVVELPDKMSNAKTDIEYNIASVARKDAIAKAKNLINKP